MFSYSSIFEFCKTAHYYSSYLIGVMVINYLFILFISNPRQFMKDSYNNLIDLCIDIFDIVVECKMIYDDHIEPFVQRYFRCTRRLFNGNEQISRTETPIDFMYTMNGDIVNVKQEESDICVFQMNRLNDELYYINTDIINKMNDNSGNESVDESDNETSDNQTITDNSLLRLLFKNMPFFHIELDDNNTTHDISRDMKKFYIKGHRFDNVFFKAFMKHFNNVNIDENKYSIKLITSEFENKTLTQDDVLYLNDPEIVKNTKLDDEEIIDSFSETRKDK